MIDPTIRADLTAILSDLSLWELSETEWMKVHGALSAVQVAVDAGEVAAARPAVAALELLSPSRITRLGAAPVGPAPPSVRLVRDRLVHDLGLDLMEAGDPPATDHPVKPARSPLVTQQELVVHHFASASGPRAAAAYRRLGEIWDRCRDWFGLTRPVPNLGLATVLPAEVPGRSASGAVAAAEDAAARTQIILRRDHDTLTLSVMCAALPEQSADWSALDERWQIVADDGSDPLLGVARLYLGLVPPTGLPSLSRDGMARAAGFSASTHGWLESGVLAGGCATWELTPSESAPPERRFVVLADDDPTLSAWAWSRGSPEAAPFTRYLFTAARVRYQMRVWEQAQDGLEAAYDDAPDDALITRAISRHQDMLTSVRVAQDNLAALIGSGAGFVADDRSSVAWLRRQLETDNEYLQNAHSRVPTRSAPRTPALEQALHLTPTIGLVTAMQEECAAMHHLIADPVERTVADDYASYVLGTMPSSEPGRPHHVALTLLTGTANPAAAAGVTGLFSGFNSIDQVIMVGVAAGIPAPGRPEAHMRLGDVVVATWGVVPYDHLVHEMNGTRLRQPASPPSAFLTSGAHRLAVDEERGLRPWEELIDEIATYLPAFARPPAVTDRLFTHDGPDAPRLRHPSSARTGHRPGRPKVHYAAIGSADRSVRSSAARDAIAGRWEVRAIEMEGHGVSTAAFATGRHHLVVRGISDYADSRFGRAWRRYASAAAAAYTAALLRRCPPLTAHGGRVLG
jgi:nucleoside phosphorylase